MASIAYVIYTYAYEPNNRLWTTSSVLTTRELITEWSTKINQLSLPFYLNG